MTTTQELIARLRIRGKFYPTDVNNEAADALDALQTEVARLQACGNGAGCCYKASTFEALEVDKEALQAENAKQATDHIKIVDAIAKQRDAALARLAATEKQEPVGYVLSCGDLTMSIIREKGYYKDQEMSLYAAAGASPQPVQPSQAWDALREWGCTGKDMSLATIMQRGDDLANALRNRCAQPVQPAESAEFKNFHSQLCVRFGYFHDERDWKRDQVSLIEHIAKNINIVHSYTPFAWCIESTNSADWSFSATEEGVKSNALLMDADCIKTAPFPLYKLPTIAQPVQPSHHKETP